jgi:hypothetical protein
LKHKKEGMFDIINNACKELDCKTKPNYNFKSEKKAIYCVKHKKEGMVDIKIKLVRN